MTRDELRQHKSFWIALYVAYFCIGYFVISFAVAHRIRDVSLAMAWEQALPLVPSAIFGYLVVYIAIICFFWKATLKMLQDHAPLYFWVVSLHFAIFFLFPLQMDRPTVTPDGTLSMQLTYWYFLLDPPRNIFPSLHVSFPLIASLIMWKHSARWGQALLGMTAIVAISVVLVKQHYVADVVAAGIVTPGLFMLWRHL
jgi:hypothetical protein